MAADNFVHRQKTNVVTIFRVYPTGITQANEQQHDDRLLKD
jgi:hypothetical protein